MIIKKKLAASYLNPPSPMSPLESEADAFPMDLSPDDFEAGKVPDRRRNDRRQGYRRVEDQELITRAHEEANAIREAAQQEGFTAGLEQAQHVIDELQTTMQSLLNVRETALVSAADDLGQMAIEIAERIIKTEVSCDESLVMSVVRNTIAKVGQDQKSILIKVNPLDVKLVKEQMKTDSPFSDSVEILVTEEDTIDPGSCVVETRAGQIDASFSTQLELLKRLLATGGKF